VNFAKECTSDSGTGKPHPPHYTLRSMPRSQSSLATGLKLESPRETARAPRRQTRNARRLNKRVVQKTDGRYLIYYEKA
jgi:hypothetical protein